MHPTLAPTPRGPALATLALTSCQHTHTALFHHPAPTPTRSPSLPPHPYSPPPHRPHRGGTFFPALGAALDAPHAGHAVLFPGRLEHAGQPITRGTRYVIVLFLGLDENASGRPEDWVLREWEEQRQGVCDVEPRGADG